MCRIPHVRRVGSRLQDRRHSLARLELEVPLEGQRLPQERSARGLAVLRVQVRSGQVPDAGE